MDINELNKHFDALNAIVKAQSKVLRLLNKAWEKRSRHLEEMAQHSMNLNDRLTTLEKQAENRKNAVCTAWGCSCR